MTFWVTLSACKDQTNATSTPRPLEPPETTSFSSTVINNSDGMSYLKTKGQNYTIYFSPMTSEIPLNRYFDMNVEVKGFTGQKLKMPVILTVDAGMRAHNHGMSVKPKIIDLGEGKYKVEGMMFHMPGNWFLEFSVQRGIMKDKAETNVMVAINRRDMF